MDATASSVSSEVSSDVVAAAAVASTSRSPASSQIVSRSGSCQVNAATTGAVGVRRRTAGARTARSAAAATAMPALTRMKDVRRRSVAWSAASAPRATPAVARRSGGAGARGRGPCRSRQVLPGEGGPQRTGRVVEAHLRVVLGGGERLVDLDERQLGVEPQRQDLALAAREEEHRRAQAHLALAAEERVGGGGLGRSGALGAGVDILKRHAQDAERVAAVVLREVHGDADEPAPEGDRRARAAPKRAARSLEGAQEGALREVACVLGGLGVAADDGEDERLVAPDELAKGVVVADEEGGDERLLLPALRGHPARDDAQCRPVAFVVHAVRRGHVLQDPLPDRRLKTNPGAGFQAFFRDRSTGMLDLRAVAQDYESFERRLARRGEAAVQALAPVRPLAARRRELNVQIERQKKEQNEANAKMREVAKTDKGAVEGARAQLRALGDEVKKSEQELAQVEAEIERLLLLVPNPPSDS